MKQSRRGASTGTTTLYRTITPPGSQMPPVLTKDIFKHAPSIVNLSPIDRFTDNCNGISKLIVREEYLNKSENIPAELATMAILGYVSAFESYIRAILVGLISIDEYAQIVVERKTLTYGAAINHSRPLLPDALLEGTSFASRDNIKDALREFLRLKVADMHDLDDNLKEFQRICEVRHCCVHRFGRLGSNNAINLGLGEHASLLEARVSPDIDQLQEIFLAIRVLVRSLNATIFSAIIERTTSQIRDDKFPYTYQVQWTWRWNSDRTRFMRYYTLFQSTKDVVTSPDARDVYNSFRVMAKAGMPRVGKAP